MLCRRIPMRFARRLRASQGFLPLTWAPPYEISFKTFHLAHRHLVCHLADHLVIVDTLLILPALDPSPNGYMLSYLELSGKSRISAPADTWYVIRFTVRTVHCQKHICNFSAKRRFSVDRRLTDKSIQEDLIDRK